MAMLPDLTTAEKNTAIACLERKLEGAHTASGTASLAEVETHVAALRIAIDTDPNAVTDQQVANLVTQIQAVHLSLVEDTSGVIAGFMETLP